MQIDYTPTSKELASAGISEEEGKHINFKKGEGCVHCDNTGYSGRTGIFEMLEITPEIRKLIFTGENQDVIRDAAIRNNMMTLHESGIEKVKMGITSIQEVIKFTISEQW